MLLILNARLCRKKNAIIANMASSGPDATNGAVGIATKRIWDLI